MFIPNDILFLIVLFSGDLDAFLVVKPRITDAHAKTLLLKNPPLRNQYLLHVFEQGSTRCMRVFRGFLKKDFHKSTLRLCMWRACTTGNRGLASWMACRQTPAKRFSVLRADLGDMVLDIFKETVRNGHLALARWFALLYFTEDHSRAAVRWCVSENNARLLAWMRKHGLTGSRACWDCLPGACASGNVGLVRAVARCAGPAPLQSWGDFSWWRKCHRSMIQKACLGGNPNVLLFIDAEFGECLANSDILARVRGKSNDAVRDGIRKILNQRAR